MNRLLYVQTFLIFKPRFISRGNRVKGISYQWYLSSQIARELDQFLEQYGRNVTVQMKLPVDWLADPRRTNNTWEPWIPSDVVDTYYPYNAAVQLAGLAYYLHIGVILVTVICKAFVWTILPVEMYRRVIKFRRSRIICWHAEIASKLYRKEKGIPATLFFSFTRFFKDGSRCAQYYSTRRYAKRELRRELCPN